MLFCKVDEMCSQQEFVASAQDDTYLHVAWLVRRAGRKLAHMQVAAILNDTVATLLALRYSQPDTFAGIILGTGTNAAYLERIDRPVTTNPSVLAACSVLVLLPVGCWEDCEVLLS